MDQQSAVIALYEAIRDECDQTVWSRAEHLAKTGTVDGKRTHNDEIEVKITTRGGMVSPLVVLSPTHRDWSCDCASEQAACVHCAAAVIAIHASMTKGDDVPSLKVPTAKVAYRLKRVGPNLAIERRLVRAGKESPLKTRLTQAVRKGANDDIVASQADMAVDVVLGPLSAGRIPRPLMTRLLHAMKDCTDVQLDGKPVRLGDPRPVIVVYVQDHADGFIVAAEPDAGISEIFENGAVLRGQALCAIGELDLSSRDGEELRKGRLFGFGDVADLAGRVLPALRSRVPLEVRSKILPTAVAMPPRLVLQTDYDGDALTVMPLIVYGDPPAR